MPGLNCRSTAAIRRLSPATASAICRTPVTNASHSTSLTPGTRFTFACSPRLPPPPDDRIASHAVAGPAITGCRRRNDGQPRHRFLASPREPQRGTGKLAGELNRELDAAQLVIDLDRETAPRVDIRHQLWTAIRFGHDTSRVPEPRVNHDVQPHGVLLPAAQWRVTTRRMHPAG